SGKRPPPQASAFYGEGVINYPSPPRQSPRSSAFGPLFVLGEDVAFFGRGEAALRRQAQLIQRDIFNRFVDALLDVAFVLKRAGLRRDQSKHELLFAFWKKPQRLDTAGAVADELEAT